MRMKDISSRRQLLARKNYGRRQKLEFLTNLSFALSQKLVDDDLISLEETDYLHDSYVAAFRLSVEGQISAYQQTWLSREKDALELKLNCFKYNVTNNEVILFSRGYDYCGALKVNLYAALEHVFELLFIDEDSVSLLDEGKKNGFILDVHEDHSEEESNEIYELVIWGDDWVKAIRKC